MTRCLTAQRCSCLLSTDPFGMDGMLQGPLFSVQAKHALFGYNKISARQVFRVCATLAGHICPALLAYAPVYSKLKFDQVRSTEGPNPLNHFTERRL